MSGYEIGDAYTAAERVLADLPTPDYGRNYQPAYDNHQDLTASLLELQITDPVTSQVQVDALSLSLERIAEGQTERPIVIVGGCHERVDASLPIDSLVEQSTQTIEVVAGSALRHAVTILRNRGQSTKPRSSSSERLADGSQVASHMGDAVNSRQPTDRQPNPGRMVEAAIQARDLERGLTVETGRHVPAAHEALLLAYERSFLRRDSTTGQEYLLSADLPWIGLRTNSPDGVHVKLMAGVENPIGVKIGADTTPEQIVGLAEALNPSERPGKLALMFRLGINNLHKLPPLLKAVKSHAAGSILMSDIHGATQTRSDGDKKLKIRLVDDIIQETQAVAALCQAQGLKLHGVHLETTPNQQSLECIDSPDQVPEAADVDPQLNPQQTRRVLNSIAPYMALKPAA